MEIIGYIAALLIGISLGLIGGGGSILTVPVLVYLLQVDAVMATAYSLFIVGVSSLVGSIAKYRNNEVDVQTAIIFGVPAIISVFFTRRIIIPSLPDVIFSVGGFVATKQVFIMVLFGVLMLIASISMMKRGKHCTRSMEKGFSFKKLPLIIIEGLVVGFITGLVGAGGGFLIIPTLVLISGLSMKVAVGTSLLIIAAKSLIGFIGDVMNYDMDWNLLVVVSLLAVVGIFIGNMLSRRVNGVQLKRGFGWFVLVMGIYIIFKELVFKEVCN